MPGNYPVSGIKPADKLNSRLPYISGWQGCRSSGFNYTQPSSVNGNGGSKPDSPEFIATNVTARRFCKDVHKAGKDPEFVELMIEGLSGARVCGSEAVIPDLINRMKELLKGHRELLRASSCISLKSSSSRCLSIRIGGGNCMKNLYGEILVRGEHGKMHCIWCTLLTVVSVEFAVYSTLLGGTTGSPFSHSFVPDAVPGVRSHYTEILIAGAVFCLFIFLVLLGVHLFLLEKYK